MYSIIQNLIYSKFVKILLLIGLKLQQLKKFLKERKKILKKKYLIKQNKVTKFTIVLLAGIYSYVVLV